MCFSFWGTSSPRPPIGAPPLDPAGGPVPRPPRLCSSKISLKNSLCKTANFLSRNLFAPGGPAPIGARALRLQPHQPHGWSGHGLKLYGERTIKASREKTDIAYIIVTLKGWKNLLMYMMKHFLPDLYGVHVERIDALWCRWCRCCWCFWLTDYVRVTDVSRIRNIVPCPCVVFLSCMSSLRPVRDSLQCTIASSACFRPKLYFYRSRNSCQH